MVAALAVAVVLPGVTFISMSARSKPAQGRPRLIERVEEPCWPESRAPVHLCSRARSRPHDRRSSMPPRRDRAETVPRYASALDGAGTVLSLVSIDRKIL